MCINFSSVYSYLYIYANNKRFMKSNRAVTREESSQVLSSREYSLNDLQSLLYGNVIGEILFVSKYAIHFFEGITKPKVHIFR